jgi:hypothetical protein
MHGHFQQTNAAGANEADDGAGNCRDLAADIVSSADGLELALDAVCAAIDAFFDAAS